MIHSEHEMGVRHTGTSAAEGRLRVDAGSRKKKHLKKIIKSYLDGKGGPRIIKNPLASAQIAKLKSLGMTIGGVSMSPGGITIPKGKAKKVSMSALKSLMRKSSSGKRFLKKVSVSKLKAIRKAIKAKQSLKSFKSRKNAPWS